MKSNNIALLDCTLRDGGYINNWMFGNSVIRSVITRLDNAGIDIIECGFLDSRESYNKDRSIYPDIPSVAKTLAESSPKKALLVAMIDYGTFDCELLIPKSETILDGIRLIFKKEDADEALEYARDIKRMGYILFINPVALTSYHDAEIIELINKVNEVEPYGMSIVDTYGLMFNDTLEKYIKILDKNLSPLIQIGYHAHNNLDMSNAHCISFLNKIVMRDIIVDSSVLGMGKNAGNACTELIASYLDKTGKKTIDMNQIFECAYTDISKFKVQSNWGYSLNFLLTAINDCSPNWIEFLLCKNTLSVEGIRTILDTLPYEKREVSYFNKELAERKYLEYMDKHVNDKTDMLSLKKRLTNRDVLIICPGKSIIDNRNVILKFIDEKKPVIFTVNFITELYHEDFVFISNSNRYSQAIGALAEINSLPDVLVTSNIVRSNSLNPIGTFNYRKLYEDIQGDNGAVLLMCLLINCGTHLIHIAGFDGFGESGYDHDYYDDNMRFVKDNSENANISKQLQNLLSKNKKLSINWLTDSMFKSETLLIKELQ